MRWLTTQRALSETSMTKQSSACGRESITYAPVVRLWNLHNRFRAEGFEDVFEIPQFGRRNQPGQRQAARAAPPDRTNMKGSRAWR